MSFEVDFFEEEDESFRVDFFEEDSIDNAASEQSIDAACL